MRRDRLTHQPLVVLWVYLPFETVFQSISDRITDRGRKNREKIDEKNMSKDPQTERNNY